MYVISVTNAGGTGNYTFRAIDTTLFNPRWGTNGGNDVLWGLVNVSDMPVTGILTLFDINGQVITSVQTNIPAGGRVSRCSGTSDINLPRNAAGSAIFSHNGPPNAILGDAFMVNSSGAPPLPVKFETLAPR